LKFITKFGNKKALSIIFAMAFLCYFISESVLRQFVLYRTGTQSISLNSILAKLPSGIRDDVTKRIMIAELQDKLSAASSTGEKIIILISLAQVKGEEDLKKQYAEIIEKYPNASQAEPAFIYYLKAPKTALKSISISRFHEYLKILREPELFYAWSSGFAKLQSRNVSKKELYEYLFPLLKYNPKYREYKQLYTELVELAFREKDQQSELKARKFEELCEKLPFHDTKLARKLKKKKKKKKTTTKKSKK
jgi:hypothetical protein